jgi:DNA-binding CsgD family transcriptional regulator
METSTPKIPAGIADLNYEFYEKNGEVYFLQNGQEHEFKDIGFDFHTMIREDLENHPRALRAMEECGIDTYESQNKRWAICNFGDFDNHADLTRDGVIVHEHVKCPYRGSCKFEGVICVAVKAPFGTITPRELQIIKLIAIDLLDKMIADKLSMSINTMNVHRANIERKIGCHSKAGIAAFAYQKNLI